MLNELKIFQNGRVRTEKLEDEKHNLLAKKLDENEEERKKLQTALEDSTKQIQRLQQVTPRSSERCGELIIKSCIGILNHIDRINYCYFENSRKF